VNVFATPGLGSLLARRFFAGSGQLLLSLSGFCMVMYWMIQKMRVYYGQMFGTNLSPRLGEPWGKWGLICFAASWIWTIGSSILLIMRAKDEMPIPPKIT
jgi:hypothetical protein